MTTRQLISNQNDKSDTPPTKPEIEEEEKLIRDQSEPNSLGKDDSKLRTASNSKKKYKRATT